MSKFRRNKEMIRSSNDYNNNSNNISNGGSAERKVSQTKVIFNIQIQLLCVRNFNPGDALNNRNL